jgi:hypothetical protein
MNATLRTKSSVSHTFQVLRILLHREQSADGKSNCRTSFPGPIHLTEIAQTCCSAWFLWQEDESKEKDSEEQNDLSPELAACTRDSPSHAISGLVRVEGV